jgi:hypothetical protein
MPGAHSQRTTKKNYPKVLRQSPVKDYNCGDPALQFKQTGGVDTNEFRFLIKENFHGTSH